MVDHAPKRKVGVLHPRPARPRVGRHVLAVLLLALVAAVCMALGFWQVERAQLRRDLQHTIEQGRARPAITLAADTPMQDLQAWRAAQARGVWRNDLTVLIQNRNQNGRPGYWVATPFMLEGGAVAVLVLRGWLPRRFDGLPPEVPVPQSGHIIHGQLLGRVPRMYELPSLWGKTRNPQPVFRAVAAPVVTNLTVEDAARGMGLNLLPVVLQQLPDADMAQDGLIRQWEGPSLDADKNVGYAIQWFSFSAIALCAALVVAWRIWRRIAGWRTFSG